MGKKDTEVNKEVSKLKINYISVPSRVGLREFMKFSNTHYQLPNSHECH
jgi:hypothetical protein